jgi:hypothetical protein
VLVVVPVLGHLGAVSDEVSQLAALEASPHVPPHVHSVLVHPLKPSGQQRQLILSKHVELLICIVIKEDKENILVDRLALDFPFQPPMRARL